MMDPMTTAIRIPRTVTVQIDKPVPHQKTLTPGMSLRIVPDGQGAEIDDVSKTIWRSRAETLSAALKEEKGIHA